MSDKLSVVTAAYLAREAARVRFDQAVREAHGQHSVRAISEVCGLSHGRIGQIVKPKP